MLEAANESLHRRGQLVYLDSARGGVTPKPARPVSASTETAIEA